ncbi:Alpha/Beta hydrolase protein [Dendryphion nanum]|uniref:Alpha/Beta hydrolase protein n=1 Tax=Dendryphion nanum TaxID=256645 RepID=A0A9P9DWU6_9PLEO|nr:Alpha/Beta hydrolase protein [Dendryphion nanum]
MALKHSLKNVRSFFTSPHIRSQSVVQPNVASVTPPWSLEMHESQTMILPDGRTLGYSTYGPSTGYPVVYMHGLPGSRIDARCLPELDNSKSLKFIGIDRPGMGLSTIQEGRRLKDWPNDVKSLVDHLNIDSFKVVGESGGGPYALACAHAFPRERLRATGIIYGVAPLETGLHGMNWRQYIGWKIAPRSQWLLRTLTTSYFGKAAQDPNPKTMEDLIEKTFFRDLNEEEGRIVRKPAILQTWIDSFRETFRNGGAGYAQDTTILGSPWGFDMNDIDGQNILIFHGEKDTLAPARMAHYMHEKLKGSVLKIYDGETHMTLFDEEHYGKAIIRDVAESE